MIWLNTTSGRVWQAFKWTRDGGMVPIAEPNVNSRATRISNDGSTILGKIGSSYALWRQNAGMTTLPLIDSYIVRLDAAGNFTGAHVSEGSGTSSFRDLELADDGSLVATGYLRNTVDYMPGVGSQLLSSVNGSANGVVMKLNSDLSLAWARSFVGNGEALPVEVDVDAQDNVYLGGSFGRLGVSGPYDFDPGPGVFELFRPSTYETAFAASLTASGDFCWAVPLGGNEGLSRVQGVSVSTDGTVHLSGAFKGTADFDPNLLAESWLNSGSSQSVFVATLNQSTPQAGAPVVDAGNSQTVLVTGAATLHGTVSDDGLPNPISSTWSLHAGPGTVSFGNTTSLDTSATFSAIGTYTLKLTATDGQYTTTDFVQVIVTPVTATLASVADTYIDGGSTGTNFGASMSLVVSGKPDEAALLKWDLSSVPAGSTLLSATFTINVTNASANTYEIYELKRNWTESQATWKLAANKTNWQTAGAQGSLDIGTTVLGTISPVPGSPGATGLRSITLNAAGLAVVQGWLNNPATNFGFALQDYDNANKDDLVFSSKEATVSANRPQLQVVYVPPSPAQLRLLQSTGLTSNPVQSASPTNATAGSRAKETSTQTIVESAKTTLPTPNIVVKRVADPMPSSKNRFRDALKANKSDARIADMVFSRFGDLTSL